MALSYYWNFPCSILEALEPVPALAAGSGKEPERPVVRTAGKGLSATRSLRSIIIEDELFVAWLVEDLLETLGHEVVGIYSSGEEALAADIQNAELAVVDINLGRGMDGIQLATELRRRHSMALVFCSAYSDEATRNRIRQTLPGASLLGKPVAGKELERAITLAITAKN